MKKLMMTLVVVLGISASASAQQPGQIWIGGSVGFSSSSTKVGEVSSDYTGYQLVPEFGYVVNDKIGVGINVGFGQQEDAAGKEQTIVIAPFVRYSVLKGNVGGLFVDGGIGYTQAKNKDADVKATGFEVGFRPGVALNVSEKISLTGKFGFLGYESLEFKDGPKGSSFGLNLDLSNVLFGISLVF
ncbi:outer membrane beta-barrel protein [Viscerimonas tarda]